MSGVGPLYINIHNVTFGKRWTVPKIDPFLWTAGKVLVTREEEFAVELVDMESSPIWVLLVDRLTKQVCA